MKKSITVDDTKHLNVHSTVGTMIKVGPKMGVVNKSTKVGRTQSLKGVTITPVSCLKGNRFLLQILKSDFEPNEKVSYVFMT